MGRIKRVKGKINLADYFIWEFMDIQFEDPSVRIHVSRLLPKLIETGEFKYLRFLARHELILHEKIF